MLVQLNLILSLEILSVSYTLEVRFLFCFLYNLMFQKVKRNENIDHSVSSELNKSISFMMHNCAEPKAI